MKKQETFKEMTERFNENKEAFIFTEALRIYYGTEKEETALDALKILDRAAQS